MKQRFSVNVSTAVLSFGMMAIGAGADSFHEIQTTGSPAAVESAPGVFLRIHGDGDPWGWGFLIQGGLRAGRNAKPISDLWVLEGETWHRIPRIAPRAYDHTLVVAADGRAYSFGGVDENGELRGLDAVTVYELRRDGGALDVIVERVPVPGPNPGACSEAAAVALDGGRSILHIGGFCNWQVLDNGSREVWEYRIDSNRWQRRADLPVPLSQHSAVVYRDQVWVFGGNGPDSASNELFRYDPASDSWSSVQTGGPRPEPREDHRAAVAGHTMLVIGGIRSPFFPETIEDVWRLDLDSLRWSRAADLPTGLALMAVDVLPTDVSNSANYQLLLYGGVVKAWPVPHLVSDATLIYTSDVADLRATLAVPAVARVQGSGAFFISTLQIYNAGDSVLELELTFTPRQSSGGRVSTVSHSVLPGVLQTIDDPLTSVFGFPPGADRVGSLLIEVVSGSLGDLMVQSVVSAELQSGERYGQFFPAIRAEQALRAGESAYLNTTEDPVANRANVGLLAVSDDTRVIVTPMAPMGSALGAPASFELGLGGSVQINDIHSAFGLESVADVLIEVRVERGRALAYGSVLDGNVAYQGTSDPTTVLSVIGGCDRVTLLEIGSINGGNEFSGSASLTNHSEFDALVRADFHARGRAGVTASQQLAIAAGETFGSTDVVGELFGVSGEVGTVVLYPLNDARISATGREFAIFRDGDGDRIGTAGQLVRGVTERELLTPDDTWHFLGLRQAGSGDAMERSHLAVFNPNPEDAEITVSLFNGIDGAAEGSRSWTVRAGELIQINSVIARIQRDHDDQEKRLEVQVSHPVHMNVFRVNPWGDPITLDAFER